MKSGHRRNAWMNILCPQQLTITVIDIHPVQWWTCGHLPCWTCAWNVNTGICGLPLDFIVDQPKFIYIATLGSLSPQHHRHCTVYNVLCRAPASNNYPPPHKTKSAFFPLPINTLNVFYLSRPADWLGWTKGGWLRLGWRAVRAGRVKRGKTMAGHTHTRQ